MTKKSGLKITKAGLIICAIMVINIITVLQLFSQDMGNKTNDNEIRNFREKIFVRTDRDIYITGEEVFLKLYKLNGLIYSPSDISKVVYLELLDKNNFPLRQIKVKADISGSASFILPDNISSGNYLIRAYTNWMKNFSTDYFTYKTISIINPFESIDHLKIPVETHKAETVYASGTSMNIINDKGQIITGKSILNEADQIKYSITLSKPSYSPRVKVIVNIYAYDMKGNPIETDMSISVAKSSVVNSDASGSFYFLNNDDSIKRIGIPEYLVELEGHLLSGYVRLKTTDGPLKKTDLSLSYVGKTARCQFGKTDDNGAFNFVMKESGLNEIVIQPMSPDVNGYYVELIQPFSSSFNKFKTEGLILDSSRVGELNKVIIGMQINNIYRPYRQNTTDVTNTNLPDFYGKSENTVKMADYIELTSLREVVKEIIPNVYTLKQNGKHDFKLINKFRGMPFENKPLVLIDGVPVYDIEKVLGIDSREIEKADVINTRYFFSENIFDGIVSFVTKKGNLSVFEFDNSIFRQAYEGCQTSRTFYSPDYNSDSLKKSRIPDYRNTLYWKPDLHTGKDGKSHVEFYTSDEKANYTIVIEGITVDGKPGYSSLNFTVK